MRGSLLRFPDQGSLVMRPAISDIELACCTKFGISRAQMTGYVRSRHVAHPRQVAMYLVRTLAGASYPAIGRRFRRDHSTAIHAVRAVQKRVGADPRLAAEIIALVAAIPTTEEERNGGLWIKQIAPDAPPAPPPAPVIEYTDPLAKRLAMGFR